MKYIKELQLTNFESWLNNNIQFNKGLNIIIGNSDSGKSASFRAIDAVLNGKFKDSSITFGKKKSEVKIIFEDNHFATRIRSKKENIIQYDDLLFERVGKEIPNEYFEALGKTKLELNDDKSIDLCLYSQFANHFFITSSDIEKSKIIGSACGINIVDKIVDNVNNDIRHNNSELKHLKSTVDEQQLKLNQLQLDVDIKRRKLEQLTVLIGRVNTNYNKLVKIDHLFQNIKNKLTQISNLKNQISKNQIQISKIQNSKLKFQKLNSLYQIFLYQVKINTIKTLISENQIKISKFQNFKLKFQTLNTLIKIFKNQIQISNLKNQNSKFQTLISKIQNSKLKFQKLNLLNEKAQVIKNSLLNINSIKQRINDVNNKLAIKLEQKNNFHKETGICPLCGSVIGEHK